MAEPDTYQSPNSGPRTGLAIGALVTSCVGLILPVGPVGLVIGLVALRRANRRPEEYGGKGTAIAGVIVGAGTGLMWCLSIGLIAILLPALGQARQAAQLAITMSNLRGIGMALSAYSQDNRGAYPEPGSDWKKRLVDGQYLTAQAFDVQWAPPGVTAFHYVPPDPKSVIAFPAMHVLVYVDPQALPGRDGLVLYFDGHVAAVPRAEVEAIAKAPKPSDGSR